MKTILPAWRKTRVGAPCLALAWLSLLAIGFGTDLLSAQPPAEIPTLYIIGDSTVRNGTKGQVGWGDPIVQFFDTNRIRILNRAIGGRSSRTFLTEGRWDKIVNELKPGDFVIMQFGHNDGGSLDDPQRARGSLKGLGEATREIDNPITKKHETVHTYGWYMSKYVSDTKDKGAIPIVCSPVPRNIWKDGKVARASRDYGEWAAQVAKAGSAAFLDLNEIIARKYESLGEEKVNLLFGGDHTHTNAEGARLNASLVSEELRNLKNNPLAAFLLPETKP